MALGFWTSILGYALAMSEQMREGTVFVVDQVLLLDEVKAGVASGYFGWDWSLFCLTVTFEALV